LGRAGFVASTRRIYRIDRLLYKGRHSAVFKASLAFGKLKGIQTVAVKILHGFGARPHLKERFLREAEFALRCKHPRIVQAYDFGAIGAAGGLEGRDAAQGAAGKPCLGRADRQIRLPAGEASVLFLVSEYISGPTMLDALRQIRRGKSWELVSYLRTLSALADALLCIEGDPFVIAHRDIKPSNILLGRSMSPKLTDFGCARTLFRAEHELRESFVGTPRYMSPEQRLDPGKADIRSDIFSLGKVFAELSLGLKWPDRLRIQKLLDKMCAEDPRQRFQGPGELIEALGSSS
jgi:serine/threonine protein kinase